MSTRTALHAAPYLAGSALALALISHASRALAFDPAEHRAPSVTCIRPTLYTAHGRWWIEDDGLVDRSRGSVISDVYGSHESADSARRVLCPPDLGASPDDSPADVQAARIAAGDCPAVPSASSPWFCRPEMLRARKQINP